MSGHEVIECTRAEYEAQWGLKAHPDGAGALIYSGGRCLVEYVFIEPEQEIAQLENMMEAA